MNFDGSALPHELRKPLLFDSILIKDLTQTSAQRLGTDGLRAPMGRNHEVFASVLEGDEFENACLVTGYLQQRTANAIREDLCFAFAQNAVPEDIAKKARRIQLRPQLLMAARRRDE